MALLAAPLAPYPFYFVNDTKLDPQSKNEVRLLNSGLGSLVSRIDLIRKAKKRISLEYFIYAEDLSGKILLYELIKASKRGVDIRLLLDMSITVVKMNEFYAEALAAHGIQLWHYQRALDPITAQYRTHRKIFVIDGNEAITGGRNIGDDYFDLDEIYNFLDRDVYIKGKVAKAMQDSFDIYWNYRPTTVPYKKPVVKKSNRLFRGKRKKEAYMRNRKKAFEKKRKEAYQFVNDWKGLDKVLKNIERVGRPLLESSPLLECPRVTFITDLPGGRLMTGLGRDYREKYRPLRKDIFRRLSKTTGQNVYLSSPYFMPNKAIKNALNDLLGKGKNIHFLTNSLGSTDAFYVSANFYRLVWRWVGKGLKTYVHDSQWPEIFENIYPYIKQTRWGVHDKTHIYNEESFYIGTYNIDNRSDFYNSEMGIFCDGSKELTSELRNNFIKRLEHTYLLKPGKKAVTNMGEKADPYGDATKKQIRKMKRMIIPSWILQTFM
jgi:cardiolipin synthase C